MSIQKLLSGKEGLLALLHGKQQRIKRAGPMMVFSTQSATLDAATGRGGIPASRISMLTSKQGVGKTTTALHVAKTVQSLGGVVIYIDKEKKLDGLWAARIGVGMGEVKHVPYPRSFPGTNKWRRWERPYVEGILDDTMHFVNQAKSVAPNVPVLIVYDSVNTIPGKEDWLAGYEDKTVGVKARVYSDLLDEVTDTLDESPVAFLAISQHRSRIPTGFSRVQTEKISGGAAMKHAAVLVIDYWRAGLVKEGDKIVAQDVGVYVEKNQMGVPYQKATFRIRFDVGIDSLQSILDRGRDLGLFKAPTGKKGEDEEEQEQEADEQENDKMDDGGLDIEKMGGKKRVTGRLEFHDDNGEVMECKGVWGRSGLVALEKKRPGIVQSLCRQLAEAQGWAIFNPLSGLLVQPPEQEDQTERKQEQHEQARSTNRRGRPRKQSGT